METDDDAREVRDRAYYLWERAGRPCGREHEFWAQASREIRLERTPVPQQPNMNRFVAR